MLYNVRRFCEQEVKFSTSALLGFVEIFVEFFEEVFKSMLHIYFGTELIYSWSIFTVTL